MNRFLACWRRSLVDDVVTVPGLAAIEQDSVGIDVSLVNNAVIVTGLAVSEADSALCTGFPFLVFLSLTFLAISNITCLFGVDFPLAMLKL